MPFPPGRGASLLVLLAVVPLVLSTLCFGSFQQAQGQQPPDLPRADQEAAGEDHPRLDLDDLERQPLPLGLVPQNISDIKAIAVGDADDDGEAELLTSRGWDVIVWGWDGRGFLQEGRFTVPFSAEAENCGLFKALVADADGVPGNEVLIVAAATDVDGDPWATDGRFFVFRNDGDGDYGLVAEETTGTMDTMLLRSPVEGAYVVENCLAVSDLTGDGEPEIALGLAFYTRTTRVYRLRGGDLELLWEDEEDTADSNAVLPYRVGDENVLLAGMGYGNPARTGFQVRTFRWRARLGTFVRGPVTDAEGAVRSLQAGDLDGDGVQEVVLCAHQDPGFEDQRNHVMVMRPNADLSMRILLDLDMGYFPTDLRVCDILPLRGSEVVVGASGGSALVLSFASGFGSPGVFTIDAYGPEGDGEGNVTVLCEGGVARSDFMGNEEGRLVMLRCGPDLAFGDVGGGGSSTLLVGEGEGEVPVRLENVGAVPSEGGRLRLSLEDGWVDDVEVPPIPPGESREVRIPLPDGPYDGNATMVVEPSRPGEEVFDQNNVWEGRLYIPPLAAQPQGDGSPGSPFPVLVVIVIVVLTGLAIIARRGLHARSRREAVAGATPVLIWKRNSLHRAEDVLGFVTSRGSRGAAVGDVEAGVDVSSNTARDHLKWLHEEGRINRYRTSSGWLYVGIGFDPPPGTLHGLGRTARALYHLVLVSPGLTVTELVARAAGAGRRSPLMCKRMAEYNLATLTEKGLVVRLRRPDGGEGVWPRVLVLLRDFLAGRQGKTSWRVVQDFLATRGIRSTILEVRLLAPHLGVRVVREDGDTFVLVVGD